MSKIASIMITIIIIFIMIWIGIIAIENTKEECNETIDDDGKTIYVCDVDKISATIDKNEVKENVGNLRKVWSSHILRNRT